MFHPATEVIRDFALQQNGRMELRKSLPKSLLRAFVISLVIHLALIGSYSAVQFFGGDEEESPITVRLMKYSELGPPPSIVNAEQVPRVGVSVAAAKPTIGIPVPVPDMEINPEQTIATQQELSEIQSPVAALGSSTEDVVVKQDIQIEEEPEIDAFIPVEKNPIPVKEVKPEYPDLARRMGIEGTVWVKILVNKEGKVKKAVVIKSDSELLNESSLQAALQWIFTPAVMSNGPVSVWVVVPFRFQLNRQS